MQENKYYIPKYGNLKMPTHTPKKPTKCLCDLMTSRKTDNCCPPPPGKDAAILMICCCQCGLCLPTCTSSAAGEGTGPKKQLRSSCPYQGLIRANINSCRAQPIASNSSSQEPLYTCQTLKQPAMYPASSCRWQRTDAQI